jgi:AAA family ATP:ADP antiporter
LLSRLADIRGVELAAACWSFLCLLCGYYVLRPVRDEMGIQNFMDTAV